LQISVQHQHCENGLPRLPNWILGVYIRRRGGDVKGKKEKKGRMGREKRGERFLCSDFAI